MATIPSCFSMRPWMKTTEKTVRMDVPLETAGNRGLLSAQAAWTVAATLTRLRGRSGAVTGRWSPKPPGRWLAAARWAGRTSAPGPAIAPPRPAPENDAIAFFVKFQQILQAVSASAYRILRLHSASSVLIRLSIFVATKIPALCHSASSEGHRCCSSCHFLLLPIARCVCSHVWSLRRTPIFHYHRHRIA